LVRRRQDRIRRNLPDALDMLSVCADAGLGFDQSMQRVSENWKTPLGLELGRVVKEMSLGSSRAQAMRAMANRLDIIELSSFVSVILQSDQLGMSIADVLHSQANQMRIERRHWAQEQARKIPVKMLFPMIFLILPALFLIILGPALPAIQEVFSGL
jgi:tight adherence protein C